MHRLSREIGIAVNHPDMVKRLRTEGAEAVASSPGELRAVVAADREKWTRVIKNAGIRLE